MKANFFVFLLATNQQLIDFNSGVSVEVRGLYWHGIFLPRTDSQKLKADQQYQDLGKRLVVLA